MTVILRKKKLLANFCILTLCICHLFRVSEAYSNSQAQYH